MPTPIMLPIGSIHGTPEGHEAGCKGENSGCPAEAQHGMSCTSAYVRSTTTPDRYFQAKARDPRPAAIARTLGFRPIEPTEDTTPPVNPRARKPKPTAPASVTPAAPLATTPSEQPRTFAPATTTPALDTTDRDHARILAARLWDELEHTTTALTAVRERVVEVLGTIERTLDGNADSAPTVTWTNREVLEMLEYFHGRLSATLVSASPAEVRDVG